MEEEKGFVIRDKRGQSREESTSQPTGESPQAAGVSSEPPKEAGSAHEAAPPVSFSSFIFSLGTSALMLMGEKLSPDQPTAPVNLPQAKEIIDILSILEEKTKGNLTNDETTVIKDMLYTLRIKYVDATSGKNSSK